MYLSLGQNCQSLVNLVNDKHVPLKSNGRRTCLFDLSLTSYYAICELFENTFDLTTFLNFRLIDNPHGEKFCQTHIDDNERHLLFNPKTGLPYGQIVINEMGCMFNHESPGHPELYHTERWTSKTMFVDDDFKLLKDRYTTRRDNLKEYIRQAIENNYEINFVLTTFVIPRKLDSIIQVKYPSLKYTIIVNYLFEKDVFRNMSIYLNDAKYFNYGEDILFENMRNKQVSERIYIN
uniref:Papain-like cysteine peptidase n=1 Tax=Pyramimonas orientalis virus TaxID=455367 RepID=A0A7L9AZ75_POV01|nr:hypothetical protein HWQ62_00489 [Pyramimonas orientalis virus]